MGADRKIVLFIAVSLDGYIAREDGNLDWLTAVEGEGDNGFSAFYQTIDTMLMGKGTYDHLMRIVEEFPHSDKICYVFSRSETRQDPYVQFINEDIPQFVRRLKEEEGTNIWLVGGGGVLDPLLKENAVDEFIITVTPIILGKGIPLFKQNNPEIKLKLVEQKSYGQFTQMHYVREL